MKVSARILLATALAALCVAACSRGPRIISRSKMQKIYIEMFMADEWIADHSDERLALDTCLVYEPIFRKYGYDTDDFKASIEYYMRDPLRYSRMMKDIALKMEAESDKLRGIKAAEEEEAEAEEENRDKIE